MKQTFAVVAIVSLACLSGIAQDKPLTLLTDDLIAKLPESRQIEWNVYLAKSRSMAITEREMLAAESPLALSKPAPGNRAEFELDGDKPTQWFGTLQNQKLAEVIISYQTPSGGWSKAVNYLEGPRAPGTHWTSQSGDGWHYCGTFDNRTTTEQIKFLAGVYAATKNEQVKQALLKGINYLLVAQFPNGGWPQNFPIERGYHEAITLNDNAMVHVLEVVAAIAIGEQHFEFVEEPLRKRARDSFERGIACLVSMQVQQGGRASVWCAQHHPLTLEPVSARLKEPASLSGAESAEVVKFLMRHGPNSPEVIETIESALNWFESKRITDLRKIKNEKGKTDYVKDPMSKEVLWARFYDLQSGQPIFAGSDDGIIYNSFSEMAAKNKVAYDYFTTRPNDLLNKEVLRWRKRLEKQK